MKLGVIGAWYHIFRLEGYIFFGTASGFHRRIKRHVLVHNMRRPKCAQDKFLIFDLAAVPGMDATAAIVFIKVSAPRSPRRFGTDCH